MEKGKLKGMFVSGNIPAGAEYKAALQDVLKAFPYFQLAQVLFAKQMYDTHEPEASGRIKLASVYAPDRKAMYLLFKSSTPVAHQQLAEPVKVAEKEEVKYNVVYNLPKVESKDISIKPTQEKAEPSLSEEFLRKELETKLPVQTPLKETEKADVIAPQKVEEKKPEPVKMEPVIAVTVPVEEKKIEVKKTETLTPPPPPKKPYITPSIEKKPEPAVTKPIVIAKAPAEKSAPVIEKKTVEKKPEQVDASGRKPYTKPVIEKKRNLYQTKGTEKKPELPKVQTPVIVKPPLEEIKPAAIVPEKIIEKKPEEPKLEDVAIVKPSVEEIKPLPIIEEKLAETKVEETKIKAPVILEPPIIAVEPVEAKIIDEKPPVEEIKLVPVIEEKVLENTKKEGEIQAPVIEEKKTEPEKVIALEVLTPEKMDLPVIVEKEPEPVFAIPVIIEEETLPIHEPITDTNLKYSFNSWLKVIPEIGVEKKKEVKPVTQAETSDIIEKFLKKESSISRPKAEFFSPVKAAKMSITEDDTIVSETLAKIYFVQGSLPKALKAYQTLLLQFPEKKNIFAPRIEEIKALIRENTKPGTK